jgi:hypothetical protein
MTARQHDRDVPLRTCENCEGQGGWEAPILPIKWDDPTPACEWIVCKYCGGSGWEEGEPEPIEQDELPDPDCPDAIAQWATFGEREDNWWQQLHQSDKGIAEREHGWDRGERDAER